MRTFTGCVVAATIAAIVSLNDVGTAAAGPLPVNATALREAASNDVVEVRYRDGAVAAGIAFGLFGAAIASQSYYYPPYPYYYYPPYPRVYYYPPYPYYAPYWSYRPYLYRTYPRYRYYRAYPRYRYYRAW